ncbi:hypothetical protein [Delftia acidovorans]|uniref:hypothetical protein n=1 Tax=Delftia acidovorans TaxID=80866 RepID=UPI0012D32E96|nr:hypothetical protein [Delftia acidovorans]QQB53221.1 hypothetical protein I6H54_13635 [Delftia acidovorans]
MSGAGQWLHFTNEPTTHVDCWRFCSLRGDHHEIKIEADLIIFIDTKDMNRKRFLRLAYGDDIASTQAGLNKFLAEVKLEGPGVIVVPTLQNFSHTMLATVIGEDAARAFLKDRTFSYHGSTISLCSDRTLNNFRSAKVYLALWSSSHLIDEIESLHNWRSLIWVTWLPNEASAWKEAHNPELF